MKKIYTRLIQSLNGFLRQGKSPHELALAIALGITIGMFPVQGTTTLICTMVSILFRLNLVVIQLANYLSIPLMMVMLVPFYTIGHHLFGRRTFQWNLADLVLLFQHDFLGAITEIFWSVSYAVGIWLLLAPIIIGIVYFVSIKLIKHLTILTPE